MPVAPLQALEGRLEALATGAQIQGASSGEVQSDAPHPGLVHAVKVALGGLLIDDGDTPGIRPARLHAIERGRIGGAVNAGSDDSHALDTERLVERGHLFRQRRLGRVTRPGMYGNWTGSP